MANLITKDFYKQAKSLTSSKEDGRLDLLISSISQLVKTYCNNSFVDYVVDPCTEYKSIKWTTDVIQLDNSPIISVVSVKERPSFDSDYVTLTEDVDFIVDDNLYRVGASWANGPKAVEIIYTAGYAELPEDLNLALVDLIHYYMQSEYKVSRSTMGASITNEVSSKAGAPWPDHIKRILDLYRQVV